MRSLWLITAGLSLALFQQGCDSKKTNVVKKTNEDANQVEGAAKALLTAKVEPQSFVATKLESGIILKALTETLSTRAADVVNKANLSDKVRKAVGI
jgi:hypothetical protein